MIWFTAALAARLRRFASGPAGPTTIVLGAGVLWGSVWLLSALFNSAALSIATSNAGATGVRFLTVLGIESVRVLTPTLTIAILIATGVAVLASPTFPPRFGQAALGAAALRAVLAVVDSVDPPTRRARRGQHWRLR